MTTLLLRISGPMQSWGTQSQFRVRDTGLEPSKSGVIGLLCAALGRPRTEPVDDLAGLQMGVRVDQEGVMRSDYQTAGGWHLRKDAGYGVSKTDGKSRITVISTRYYLADANFLVGLQGDEALLRTIDRALAHPRWPLFLGRKAFVPGKPVRLPDAEPWGPGLREDELFTALTTYPWGDPSVPPWKQRPQRLRVVVDSVPAEASESRFDTPLSFAERRFTRRYVRTVWIDPPAALEE